MQTLDKILNIEQPVILAPMFLVTNAAMIKIALDNGISGAIPAMNFRKAKDLAQAINDIKAHSEKAFGINLIVNKSNISYKKQLKTILDNPPAYVISSLGNPKELIREAHKVGIKVFCDVVDLKFAKKVEDVGADAIIAVNSKAGGHSGKIEPELLVRSFVENCKIPIINAGGIATNSDLSNAMSWGAAGASIGTIFIASEECPVTQEYKNALIEFGAKDIVLTRKLSGANTTVINTPYMQSIGAEPDFLEKIINRNSTFKKFAKAIITKNGMNKLSNSAFNATYKTVWCASVSIENIRNIRPLAEIIQEITK